MKKMMVAMMMTVAIMMTTAGSPSDAKSSHEHPNCGMVTAVKRYSEEYGARMRITIQLQNGIKFTFYTKGEEWEKGDLCAVITHDNGTKNWAYDDRIIDCRYAGWEAKPSTWVKR